MNTDYDRAQRYAASVPAAPQGQRNDALNRLAFALLERFDLTRSELATLCQDWSARCLPPIDPPEVQRTLASAWRGAQAKGALGSRRTEPAGQRIWSAPAVRPARRYACPPSAVLPAPLPDGARALLAAAFHAGEGVRICTARLAEDGETPANKGTVLTREDWLQKLDAHDGQPNGVFPQPDGAGIYLGLNPTRGSADADVTAFRHALLEFDNLPLAEQWSLYQQSQVPCTAIIASGGKSIHAWVKVEAQNADEYRQRVNRLYDHFAAYNPDRKNRNPSRLSRLPNCTRLDRRQELLALNTGAPSFVQWLADIEAEGIGEMMTVDELLRFDIGNDADSLLGQRWLCRGGSLLFIGPSGVGKSSLVVQIALHWALGRPAFGITPKRPLKTLFIQAENDRGDLAEMFQGVLEGMGIHAAEHEADIARLRQNLIFNRNDSQTSFAFVESVRRLVEKHRPDLVLLDPLLSFIGDDISKQAICSQFLRNWLNPIATATSCIWFCVHHTGKPPNDAKARSGWKGSDHAYAGIGSSELVNWARAVLVLRQHEEGAFELKLAKRGKRAGATHPDGSAARSVWLRHADHGIRWEQVDPPPESASETTSPRPARTMYETIAFMNLHEFLAKCPHYGESGRECAARLEEWLAFQRKDASASTCRRAVEAMVANGKLIKRASRYYKGPNA